MKGLPAIVMEISSTRAFRITAALGFLGVALGAFGAHGLKDLFTRRPAAQLWWEKAVLYQFVHTAVMLIVCGRRPFQAVPWLLFGGGIVLFSGSLYLMALTNWPWLGPVTPCGGLCFLTGWAWLAVSRPAVSADP